MGHPLNSFMHELLTSSTSIAFDTRVSLVVDNARPLTTKPTTKRNAFDGPMQPKSRRQKNCLDVSDHSKGKSRWECPSVQEAGTPLQTPSRRKSSGSSDRKKGEKENRSHSRNGTPLVVEGKTLSPCMETKPSSFSKRENKLAMQHPMRRMGQSAMSPPLVAVRR
eukprot:Nitzschia sp. Nitz4//scaffold226_size53432//40653//41147//NITZ4_006705-RA/size53432-processed-gene-0.78-mRNA-1//-1//CDS//3329542763//8862//frame0